MSFSVVEWARLGKTPRQPCEDEIFVNAHYAAVIDGVTAKTSRTFRYGQKTVRGGKLAALTIKDAFDAMPAELTAEEAVIFLTKRVREALGDQPGEAGATFVAYSRCQNQVWRLGDNPWRDAKNIYAEPKLVDLINAEKRAAVLQEKLASNVPIRVLLDNDPGRRAIAEELARQHQWANRVHRLGYGVINGSQVPKEYIEVFSPRSPYLVLATDGYPVLLESLSKSEECLRKLLALDPLCIRELKNTKGLHSGGHSFDDRAWLKLKL